MNIIDVKLNSGSMLYCPEETLKRSIRLRIKSFFGKIRSIVVDIDINETVDKLKQLATLAS